MVAAAHAHVTLNFPYRSYLTRHTRRRLCAAPLRSKPCPPTSTLRLDRLIVEEGGFLYDSDAYNDDLPYWNTEHGKPHLIIPYTLDVNDMRFATPQGFNSGDQFFTYLRDSLDFLLEVQDEGHMFYFSCAVVGGGAGHPGENVRRRNRCCRLCYACLLLRGWHRVLGGERWSSMDSSQ